ncbi:MAG: PKD domain-containing protein, partial [Bacteroidota bacterium]
MKRAILLWCLAGVMNLAWTQPTADFTANIQSGCSPIVVNFENLSSNAVAYEWNLSNGNSTLAEPGQLYAIPGMYDITLVAIDGNGNRDTLTKPGFIEVYGYPDAQLSANKTEVCTFEPIQFQDQSFSNSGNITKWDWDFGDGSVSNLPNPIHSYQTPGVYQVSLVVRTEHGCADDLTINGFITVNAPNAEFQGDTLLACGPPLPVTFTPSEPNGQHVWLFGDGGSSNQAQAQHTYQQFGNFSVSHVVIDGNGCRDTVRKQNYINIGINTLSIEANDSSLCEGDSVFFVTNASPLSQVTWSFGNGDSSQQLNPGYRYLTPGSFDVEAYVIDPGGCDITLSIPITVFPKPQIDFGVADTNLGCSLPFAVDFVNQSNLATSYRWNFGDGTQSTQVNPSHSYTQADSFTVSLTAWGQNGCRRQLRRRHYVKVEPMAAGFEAKPRGGCAPLPVTFLDTTRSVYPLTSWEWDFGDGFSSNAQHPLHTYADTGYYDLTLIVENSRGCRDTVLRPGYIKAGTKPSLAFEPDTNRACALAPVQFTNLSTGADRFIWFFGDGDTAMSRNPEHGFAALGRMDVTLVGFDRGCPDTLYQPDLLEVLAPLPIMGISDKRICELPKEVLIQNLSIDADYYNWTVDTVHSYSSNSFTHTFTTSGIHEVKLVVGNYQTGCQVEAFDYIQAQPIEPEILSDTLAGCIPLKIRFRDQTPLADRWTWDFGNGKVVSTQNAVVEYKKPGDYPISLILRNQIRCVDTVSLGPASARNVEAKIGVSDQGGCVPTTIQFSDLSQGTSAIPTHRWWLNDSLISQQGNFDYVFTEAGLNNLSLTVFDQDGCRDSVTLDRGILLTQPVANFVVTPAINCEDNTSTFVSLSSGSGLSYLWTFGDGDSSRLANVTHSYADTGYYDVSLSVRDVNGCDTSLQVPQAVNIRNLQAYFTADTVFAPCPPLTVNFQADTAFPHPDLEYHWDFGDGTVSNQPHPIKNYLFPGIYDVTLVLSTPDGCADTLRLEDYVQIEGPTGQFTFDPARGCPGLEVNFEASSTDSVSYEWVFGDGTTGQGERISKPYYLPGIYTPTLVVVDDRGCKVYHVSPDPIVVDENPRADFTADTLHCDSARVQWQDLSQGADPLVAWNWDFGQGGVDSAQHPQSLYPKLGNYSVSLMVESSRGCRDTVVKQDFLRVVPSPISTLDATALSGCVDFVGRLTADAPGHPYAIQNWTWDLGTEGAFDGNPQEEFSYSQAGIYQVEVILTDENGCQGGVSLDLKAFALPEPQFVASDSFGCAPFDIIITDLTPDSIVSWRWDFGDGNGSTEPQPQHRYLRDGRYGISLEVVDQHGCVNQFAKDPYIHLSHPLADFEISDPLLCPKQPVTFTDQSQSDTLINSWSWSFGDGGEAPGEKVIHTYSQPGTYDISLVVGDVFGCRDTLLKPEAVRVLTDAVPVPVAIRQVSVSSAREVQIDYTEYNNLLEDFGAYVIFRSEDDLNWREVGRIADPSQLSFMDDPGDTEHQVYCYKVQVVNHCGTGHELALVESHCTIDLKSETTPGLEAVFLSWNHYQGWPVIDRYRLYRVDGYDLDRTTLIASLSGEDTSFVDWEMFCYDQYQYRIEAIGGPGRRSWSDRTTASPDHNPPAEPNHI